MPNSTDTASDALGFPKPDRLGLWLSKSCHPLEPTVDGSTSVTLPDASRRMIAVDFANAGIGNTAAEPRRANSLAREDREARRPDGVRL